MKKIFSLIIILTISFGLSGCELTNPFKEKKAFEPLTEEVLETISGKLFPFSVSVSTNASHRLEKNSKLVAYIASDVVNLKKFENQEVDVTGVWRHEKMRQIFWVESIHIKTPKKIIKNTEPKYERLKMKDFSFVYPNSWEKTLSPDDKAYFVDKKDSFRKVFLTFSVEPFSPEASTEKPNMKINEFSGIKTVKIENGIEKESVKLFSQKGIWQYNFESRVKPDDFERKKEILRLLMSFVEGEENVRNAIIEEQKALAKKESEKIEIPKKPEENSEEKNSENNLDKKSEENTSESKTEITKNSSSLNQDSEEKNKSEKNSEKDYQFAVYEEKIDNRAYTYNNSYKGVFMKIPYGFWFRSLGAQYGSEHEVGIAKKQVNKYSDAEIFVKVFVIDKPLKNQKELVVKNRVILTKNRNKKTVYEVSGPEKYRDEIWSIFNSLK